MSTGQTPENSSFSRRCTLLSRYLKEKGSFGNIDIGLARKSDLELVGKSDLRGQQNGIKKAETSDITPCGLIQKLSVGEASTSSGGKARDTNLSISEPAKVVPEPGNSQLTIFFGGRVIVYNEFPEDKAKQIMEVAKEASPVVVDSKNTHKHMNLDMNVSNQSNIEIPDLNEPSSSENNEDHQTGQPHQAVERIARRASLHRFFSKRKDRAVARAPYQVNQNSGHYPTKPEMVGPSVEPGQSSRPPVTPPKPKRHNDVSMEVDEKERNGSKDLDLKL